MLMHPVHPACSAGLHALQGDIFMRVTKFVDQLFFFVIVVETWKCGINTNHDFFMQFLYIAENKLKIVNKNDQKSRLNSSRLVII
jgi:hypothetical protein